MVDHYGYPREAVAVSMNILDRFSANAGLNRKLHQVSGGGGEWGEERRGVVRSMMIYLKDVI